MTDPGTRIAKDDQRPPVVLIVDDEDHNRVLLRAYLEHLYTILEAKDGASAIETIARERVDIVLLDVLMPNMTGIEACRAIKLKAGDEFLPVLLLTALSDQEDRNAGLAASADDFITKPIDRGELVLRVRAFLRIRQQEGLLRRALEDLRNLNAVQDDLFSLIVHDLRNPLSNIVGFLGLLKNEVAAGAAAKLERHVDGAIRSTDDLQQILAGVLDVRLLEEGELPLHKTMVDLGEIVKEAAEAFAGASQLRRVSFQVRVEGHPIVRVDRALVRRAAENFVANALKYSPQSTTVTLLALEEPGGASISVADCGPGIPQDLRSVLFQKFGSVEARKGSARRGYGLGLHLAKLVAVAHGGSVAIQDAVTGGAVFRLFVPREVV